MCLQVVKVEKHPTHLGKPHPGPWWSEEDFCKEELFPWKPSEEQELAKGGGGGGAKALRQPELVFLERKGGPFQPNFLSELTKWKDLNIRAWDDIVFVFPQGSGQEILNNFDLQYS